MPNEIIEQTPMILCRAHGAFDIPVRNVVRRTTRNVVGYLCSKKMGALLGWESQIEKLCFEWLEVDPDVLKYYAQPVTTKVGNARYTPDVLVVSRTAEYFIEVKPDSVFRDEETMERIRTFQDHFKAHGTELRLVTKTELLRRPFRDNVEMLWRIAQRGLSHRNADLAVGHCRSQACTIDELNTRMWAKPEDWIVSSAIILGYLRFDITKPLTGRSVVTPTEWS